VTFGFFMIGVGYFKNWVQEVLPALVGTVEHMYMLKEPTSKECPMPVQYLNFHGSSLEAF
jgi:hypothetical protein